MNQILDFVMQHKAALGVAGAWALREAHNVWPFLRPSVSLPFLRQNGGTAGILRTVRNGWDPRATTQSSSTTTKDEKV